MVVFGQHPFRFGRSTLLACGILIGALAVSVGVDQVRTRIFNANGVDTIVPTGATGKTTAQRAIDQVTLRLTTNPNDAAGYRDLGLSYLQRARETADPTNYARAESALNRAYQTIPADPEVLIGLGSLALARHQFADGLTWGEKARAVSPQKAAVYGVIGDAQLELGRYDDAFTTLQTMVDLRPDATSYSRASYAREVQGDLPGALQIMGLAADAAATEGEQGAWTRIQHGDLLLKTGDLAGAEREYRWALVADPQNMLAVAGLGHLRLASGDPNGAIPFYERAVHGLPLPALVVTLGELYEQAGRPADAQKQFALVRVVESLWQANGGNVDLDLALFEADHGDPSKAVGYAQTEVARRASVQADDALAWALFQSGDLNGARAASQQALRLGSKDPVLLFHAGMIESRLGNRDGARALLSQALQIDPGFAVHYATLARQTLNELGAGQ